MVQFKQVEISIRLVNAPEGAVPLMAATLSIMDVESLTHEELVAVVKLRVERQVREGIDFITRMRALEEDIDGDGDDGGEAVPPDGEASEETEEADPGTDSELQA